jgi:hypothetical protein
LVLLLAIPWKMTALLMVAQAPCPGHASAVGLRYGQWKVVFLQQQHEGLRLWREPPLRAQLLLNHHSDPFEIGRASS